jgi:hypothetical protein
MMIPTCTYLFPSHGIIAPCSTFSRHVLRLGYGLACRGVPRVVEVDLGESTASRGLKLAVVRGVLELTNHVLLVRLGAMPLPRSSDAAKHLQVKNQDIASASTR